MLRNQDGQIEFFDLLWYNFPKGGCFEMNEKKPVSNVCYQIAAKNGRVLEVADFNTASGAAVQLWDNVKEDSQIWLSMERNMRCAVGFCGHCQMGPYFACKDGPVFNYTQVKPYMDLYEL